MNDETSHVSDIFNGPLPGNAEQRATLERELRLAEGFSLIFALCNSADERDRQMKALREEAPELRIQDVPVREEIPHLSYLLRAVLDDPVPDAVFVFGLENWIRSDAKPRTIPFLLNLNAARNHFIKDCPCSLVFWMPEYMLSQIIGSAPDFASVRSGLYSFSTLQAETGSPHQSFKSIDFSACGSYTLDEKTQRLDESTALLKKLRKLPVDRRLPSDEAYIVDQLAQLNFSMGRFEEAEALYQQFLEFLLKGVGSEHLTTVATKNALARIYASQGRYDEAELIFHENLAITEKTRGWNDSARALTLHDLAQLYSDQGRCTDAESLFTEALDLKKKATGRERTSNPSTLNALGQLYTYQGRYSEAEALFHESLDVLMKTVGREHIVTAVAIHNLAEMYSKQGKYAEAEPLASEALAILRRLLPPGHPDIATVKNTLDCIHRTASGPAQDQIST